MRSLEGMKMKRIYRYFSVLLLVSFSVSLPLLAQAKHSRRTPVVEAFEKNKDAVVSITGKQIVRQMDPFFWDFDDWFSFRPKFREAPFLGSGFILDERGYVVTNAHVVEEATEIIVMMSDQQEYQAKKIAANRSADLALLKIEPKVPGKKFPKVTLWLGGELWIGETVLAIGNPYGYQHTLTEGIISARHRNLEIEKRTFEDLIQISAPINPGNSGGPLININGEVIGVNTAIRRAAQGIGFAIPIEQLCQEIPKMLGVQIETQLRVDFGAQVVDSLPKTTTTTADPKKQVKIATVRAESAATKAGLKKDDIITAVNGTSINSAIDFYLELLEHKIGNSISFEIVRGTKPGMGNSARRQKITMVLQARPKPNATYLAKELLGIKITGLSKRAASNFGQLAQEGNVQVESVELSSPAHNAGIEKGDILVAVDNAIVKNKEELGYKLETLEPGQLVTLTLSRIRERGWVVEVVQYDRTLRTRSPHKSKTDQIDL
jgi:serine protease Do